ncbi:hypothetical protein EV361DRAFT_954473 [Lentinula raphanica]|uniref:Uncharacterized protein n=1 Tax=Lentinula raphanica TaxID=153919 RepID=A0AA38U7R5_9AGAR|nr:hypothetical protein F5878DRAFT_633467 [Lentinula raphanica]KAJ3966009.1 hypothetical protein EV361DRAFT_954473 [Lentinula raphanica]
MTRPVHILPLGVLCVVLASTISPEVLAAPTSFEKPGDGPIPSNDLGLLGPVRARDGLKVDGHVSSCLLFAGAGAGAGAVHSRNQELDGNAVRRSLRNLKRRADFLDDPFSDTHEAAEHAPGQGGDVRSQAVEDADCFEQKDDAGFTFPSFLQPRAIESAHVPRGEPSGHSGHSEQGSVPSGHSEQSPVPTGQGSNGPSQPDQSAEHLQDPSIMLGELKTRAEPFLKELQSITELKSEGNKQRAVLEFCNRERVKQGVPNMLAEVAKVYVALAQTDTVKAVALATGVGLLDIAHLCGLEIVTKGEGMTELIQAAKLISVLNVD